MKKIISRFITLISIISLISLLIPIQTPVSAVDPAPVCDLEFYSSNDILFYNPCANICADSSTGSVGTVGGLRGTNNGEKIFNFWLDAGFTVQQAAGITGSMKHEGGFSPFRQEMSQSWPAGGWGIAQFTHDPGQRGSAVAFVKNAVGADLFSQYYKNQYGGAVVESNGFVPAGVPVDVNDKFLLAQLNYLLDHTKGLKPNNVRRDYYKRDFGYTVDKNITLHDYLKTVVQAGDAATAWTYLYEFPANIKKTSLGRANSAAEILTLYSTGSGISVTEECGGNLSDGGLNEGGMTLEEAKAFMERYKNGGKESESFIGLAGKGCPGGPLSNCVSFSVYFINKYTNFNGFRTQAPGNGVSVAKNVIARNPTVQNGHSPRPYAVFSVLIGDYRGHTGIILGVDKERGKVIVGEASCGGAVERDTAREYDLSKFDNGKYTYAYTEGFLKGEVK